MRKIILLFIGIALFNFSINAQSSNFGGGSGTENDPYIISLPEHVYRLANLGTISYPNTTYRYFKLSNDIDLSDYINQNLPEKGWISGKINYLVFDGQNYTISGLWSNDTEKSYFGFFGQIDNSIIKNLKLKTDDRGIIGNTFVGILSGGIGYDTQVINCHTEGMIEGNSCVGGLIGIHFFNTESLEGENLIENSSSSAKVIGNETIGGFIGLISDPFAVINVFGCFSEGEVVGNTEVGGFVGYARTNLNIGGNSPSCLLNIFNCYSTSPVTCSDEKGGGFVGFYSGHVIFDKCYSSGEVLSEGGGFLGGMITLYGPNMALNCYYDMETSGKIYAEGSPNRYGVSGVEGKSTNDMKEISTFQNWNFDSIWTIQEGRTYPYLKWQNIEGSLFAGGNGSEENPFRIESPKHLDNFIDHASNENNYGMHYRVMNDMDIYDYIEENYPDNGWRGNELTEFSGYLHGGGHIISGVWMEHINSTTVGGLLAGVGYDGYIDSLGIQLETRGIVAKDEAGGFVGINVGYIYSCFSMGGFVETEDAVGGTGGFVGNNDGGTIENCYTTCRIFTLGDQGGYTGGFVGYNFYGIIENCYSTGRIMASSSDLYVGGFAGYSQRFIVDNCYFDLTVSRQSIGVGYSNRTQGTVYSNTTAQMKNESYLSGLDFVNIWKLIPGYYPILQWQDNSTVPRSAEYDELEPIAGKVASDFYIYPNPTTGIIQIESNEDLQINIFDQQGRLVLQTKNKTIDISSYPSGMYFVNVNGKVERIIKR